LKLPRRLQIEFSRAVQRVADESGKEVAAGDIYTIFRSEYLDVQSPYTYHAHQLVDDAARSVTVQVCADIGIDGNPSTVRASGNGPIDAFVQALGLDIKVMDYHEHAIGAGADARAACYVELRLDNGPTLFGVGIDRNIVTASFKAVLSAVNRQLASSAIPAQAIGQAAVAA
jgi:2-isopropylmalate synthase